jgi:hypothetical protein
VNGRKKEVSTKTLSFDQVDPSIISLWDTSSSVSV